MASFQPDVNAPEFRNFVSSLIESPVFREGLERVIRTQNVSQQSPPTSISSPSMSSEQLQVATSSNSVSLDAEIRRLFPSIRRNTSSIEAIPANVGNGSLPYRGPCSRKQKSKSAHSTFSRDVILLKNPSNLALKGCKRAAAFQNGYGINAVKFEKEWSINKIQQKIREVYPNKLPTGINFDIMISLSGALVKIVLQISEQLNGDILCKSSRQKALYIRPEVELQSISHEIKIEDETSNNDCDEAITFWDTPTEEFTAQTSMEDSGMIQKLDSDLGDSDLEKAIKNSLEEQSAICLEDIIRTIQAKIDKSKSCNFNINRDSVFDCCIRAMRRKTFSPFHRVSVLFTDIAENSEGAIDNGGPTRELWRLLLDYIKGSQLFEGLEFNKNLSLDSTSLENRHYFEAGRIISMSLGHGGPGPHFFSNCLYSRISHGLYEGGFSLEDVGQEDIRKEIQRIANSHNLEELQEAVIDSSTFLILTGCSLHVKEFAEKERIITRAIRFYVINRTNEALEQFIDGLQTLGVYDCIKKHHTAMKNLMCYEEDSKDSLTAEILKDLLKVIAPSPQGSNRACVENKLIGYWRDYLQDCEEADAESSLSDVLAFSTAANRIPPLGFEINPSLEFLHDDTCPYPKANTCSMVPKLPVVHSTYSSFKSAMDFGIKNGMVFGFE